MKLSIIIVNYNVRAFLDACLASVYKAIKTIDAEIFVVDNHSSDDSLPLLAEKYPRVKCIANSENVGFAKANNQAIRLSQGEYVLLLNPDTLILTEDTFEKMLAFMDAHSEAGGMGVRMIDAAGRFLKESKRGVPTPAVSFCKAFGLSALFPKSKVFGRYHLAYLDEHEIHQVDILSGACMLMRKSVLDETGLLDESFFMYGEDIDLSYRIVLAGYANYYYPEVTILHYKGESTKKGSMNYIYVFYKAMAIFAKKYYSGKYRRLYFFLIQCAIVFRATLAALAVFFRKMYDSIRKKA